MPQITIDNTTELARYEFAGSSLPTEWNILKQNAGQSVSIASSILTITAGTTANSETIVRCTNKFRIKAYVRFVVSLSQRIANQNIYLEVTNAAGTTFARYDFNGVTATTAQCQTGNQGTNNTAVSITCPTTASFGTYDIYADTQDVVFSSTASNANSIKSGIASFDRLILDPDEDYFVQVRVLNGATAPASSTNINVDAVVLQDLTGVKVDIIRGDGTGSLTNTAPVQVLAMPTTNVASAGAAHDAVVSGNPFLMGAVAGAAAPTAVSAAGDAVRIWATLNGALVTVRPTLFYNDTTTPLAASATFTGTARDNAGTTAANISIYSEFNVTAVANQAGTLRIEMSNDNTTWRRATPDTAVAANSPVSMSVPVVTRYYRAVYVNGATLQGEFMLNSSYSPG